MFYPRIWFNYLLFPFPLIIFTQRPSNHSILHKIYIPDFYSMADLDPYFRLYVPEMVSGFAGVVGVHNLRSKVVVIALVPANNQTVNTKYSGIVTKYQGKSMHQGYFYPRSPVIG